MTEAGSCPQSLAGAPPVPMCHLSWVLPQFCLAPSLAPSLPDPFSNFFLDLNLTNPLAREACFGGTRPGKGQGQRGHTARKWSVSPGP